MSRAPRWRLRRINDSMGFARGTMQWDEKNVATVVVPDMGVLDDLRWRLSLPPREAVERDTRMAVAILNDMVAALDREGHDVGAWTGELGDRLNRLRQSLALPPVG